MSPWVLILCFAAALQLDRCITSVIAGAIASWQRKRMVARMKATGARWSDVGDYDVQLYPVSDKRKEAN